MPDATPATHPRRRNAVLLGAAALVAVLALVALVALVDPSGPARASGSPTASSGSSDVGTVSTTATGKVNAVPDDMVVSLSVHTEGSSAASVLSDDNAKAQALLTKLHDDGVADKDVQTTSVSLQPRWNNSGDIDGYQADNELTVTFRDLSKAGGELDDLVGLAGDAARIQSIQLGFGDEDSLLDQARADGVQRAKAQAQAMAKAAGVSLGAVRSITEVSSPTIPVYEPEAAAGAASDGASVPVSAGSKDVTVDIKVVFALA